MTANKAAVRDAAHTLIGSIADCAFRLRYPPANGVDEPPPPGALFDRAEQLLTADPPAVRAALDGLLRGELVPDEPDLIKLECAELYGRDALSAYVLRLRYALGLADEDDAQLLSDRIKAAFSERSGSVTEQLDRQRPWEKLVDAVLKKTDPRDARLADTVTRVLTPDAFPGADGAVAYTFLCKEVSGLRPPTARMKTVALVVSSLAVIQGDGLDAWLCHAGKAAPARLSAALEHVGLPEAASVVREVDACRSRPDADETFRDFGSRLCASYTDAELTALAEAYLADRGKRK